eukprot:8711612-Alexandrium_andersonii.AAC.1
MPPADGSPSGLKEIAEALSALTLQMRSLQSEVSALKQPAPVQPLAPAQEAQPGVAPPKRGGKDR